MSQRDSGYSRIERDAYETPEWVTEALLPHLPPKMKIWECAQGSGKMSKVLAKAGHDITGTDIEYDFLSSEPLLCDAIVTNPPYELATEFIDHSLSMIGSMVAMLLRTDFDHAISRYRLFAGCPQFAKKVVLTRRIKWFENSTGSPSFNHAWFIWDWKHSGPPILAYAPIYS